MTAKKIPVAKFGFEAAVPSTTSGAKPGVVRFGSLPQTLTRGTGGTRTHKKIRSSALPDVIAVDAHAVAKTHCQLSSIPETEAATSRPMTGHDIWNVHQHVLKPFPGIQLV